MSISDNDLLSFFRRKTTEHITQKDIDLSTDVWPLQPLIFYLCYSIKAMIMVEIGTADGSTAIPMIKAAQENGGILYSVDPSGCDDAHRLVKNLDALAFWEHKQMESDEFFKDFDKEIDFALIDGNHAFPQVARDVRNCCQRLSLKGLVFVTDFVLIKQKITDYMGQTEYNDQCANGIHKGLKLVLNEFPDLNNITLFDRINATVIIGRNCNRI